METVKIKTQLITPSIAKSLLERNVSNRRINEGRLLAYTKDMINGKWKEGTAEPIKISKTGIILDGQHRLLAIVKSNCSILCHVAENLEDAVFDVLDTGKSRNASDCFNVAGVKMSNTLPSIIAHYNLLQEGKKVGQQRSGKATNAELLDQYYEDELFWQNVGRTTTNWYIAFAKILTPSMIGGFYAHLYKINPIKAELFMSQLCTGSDINNQTINLLRTKLMQDKMSPRKMPPTLKMALIIKTWNNFINGTEVKILKFDTVRDDFPTAIK